jgi:hypothetical protein
MPDGSTEARNRALHALDLMRDRISLEVAARRAGTSPATVLRHVGTALHRTGEGWIAAATDGFDRRLLFVFPDGSDFVTVRGSDQASLISNYWRALRRLVESGDDSGLRKFAGRSVVDVSGKRHFFVTDRATLNPLIRSGQVSGFNSIY